MKDEIMYCRVIFSLDLVQIPEQVQQPVQGYYQQQGFFRLQPKRLADETVPIIHDLPPVRPTWSSSNYKCPLQVTTSGQLKLCVVDVQRLRVIALPHSRQPTD
jgi:hypothetical protein